MNIVVIVNSFEFKDNELFPHSHPLHHTIGVLQPRESILEITSFSFLFATLHHGPFTVSVPSTASTGSPTGSAINSETTSPALMKSERGRLLPVPRSRGGCFPLISESAEAVREKRARTDAQ